MATETTYKFSGGGTGDWTGNITINQQTGTTVTIDNTNGKYLDQKIKFNVAAKTGSVTPAINAHSITSTPTATGKITGKGSEIGTTTKPSGTDGTDYWAFTPGVDTASGVSTANAKATVSSGWIQSNPSNSSNHTVTVAVSASNGTTRYLPKGTMSGSVTNAAATTTVAPGSVTISTNAATVSGKTRLDISPTTATTGISTYFLAYKANAAANTSGATSSISGTGSASIGTAGYMPSGTSCSISASGTATAKTSSKDSSVYYVPLASAAISASGTGAATTTVAPGNVTIANNTTAVSGKTRLDASPTTATTDIGTYYMAVLANAAANTTGSTSAISGTASASCGTAGWAPTTLTGSGSVTGTATAKTSSKDSSVYYIPLASAAVSVTGGGLSGTNYSGTPTLALSLDSQTTDGIGITDTAQSSGYYLKLTTTSNKLTGNTKVDRAAVNLAQTAGYLAARANSATINSTSNSPSVTVNTATKTRYITIPTATFAVSGNKVYCSARGWVPTGSTSSVVGTVGTGTITNNTTLPSGVSSSGTINRGSYIKIGAGYHSSDAYYLAQNVSNGTITNNTSGGTSSGTINFGKQIKIGAGYYSSDAYYTAQSPTGTTTLGTGFSAATDINISGKAAVNITGLTLPKGKSFSLVVYAGASTTNTFTFTTDANGNTTVTGA